MYDGGDHSIVVGEVVGVDGPEGAAARGPLLHYAGRYRRLRSAQD